MGEIKKYFKEETQTCMLGLEHPKPSDFYISAFQGTRSSVPLLIFRCFLLLSAVSIVIWSTTLYIINGIYGYWFIYLTHWGLTSIVLATGFSVAVSARIYLYGPVSADTCLPWYVKTYWVLFNVANPTAYLITIFYWTVLYEAGIEEELDHSLDIAVHGINTVIMLLLLFSSAHPSRLLHIHHPVMFGLGWTFFSLIFYLAGGTAPSGSTTIYPVINWAQPGTTIGVVALTGLLLLILHLATIGLSLLRDVITSQWCRPSVTNHLEEGTPLRQQTRIN